MFSLASWFQSSSPSLALSSASPSFVPEDRLSFPSNSRLFRPYLTGRLPGPSVGGFLRCCIQEKTISHLSLGGVRSSSKTASPRISASSACEAPFSKEAASAWKNSLRQCTFSAEVCCSAGSWSAGHASAGSGAASSASTWMLRPLKWICTRPSAATSLAMVFSSASSPFTSAASDLVNRSSLLILVLDPQSALSTEGSLLARMLRFLAL
mmetsp:Transcript_6942/g.14536  ORF Transcript_6942/g.14536 Transcript_6942/m.14536 type:complete len:210 (-) Transcript_6942:1512-2141(-)